MRPYGVTDAFAAARRVQQGDALKKKLEKTVSVTLPKKLSPTAAESMLVSKAKKKGGKLAAWKYDPKTGRAVYRWQ